MEMTRDEVARTVPRKSLINECQVMLTTVIEVNGEVYGESFFEALLFVGPC